MEKFPTRKIYSNFIRQL